RWFAVTEDTTIDATIESRLFDGAYGPWFLDVYAMNRDLYAHLMTGAPGDFFPVPPAQNVIGGLGPSVRGSAGQLPYCSDGDAHRRRVTTHRLRGASRRPNLRTLAY
ncbi:MAG TPA: hypothetical protein VH559_12450, partial [Gemmatimonadaceae bacterium]